MLRLPIETLENRTLLTAFVVNTLSDDATDLAGTSDGQVSLREAITAANTNTAFGDAAAGNTNGDTITFAPALAGQTITLGNGQYNITDDVSINGNVTLDANSGSRVFNITSAQTVALSNLTLTNGSVVATGTPGGGGAIYTENTALTVTGGKITGNTAGGATGSGGGLFQQSGSVRIVDTQITDNQANRAGGGIEIITGNLVLERVALGKLATEADPTSGNRAGTGAGSTASPGNGGGLHVTGAARVDVIGGRVEGNTAALEGGGLWNSATGTMRVLGGVVVSSNSALGNAADDGGGGIFNNGGNLLIENSTITKNDATGTAGSGGGLLSVAGDVSIQRSTLSENKAVRAGGGVEVIVGNVRFNGSTLRANSTGTAPGNGGGLHSTGAAVVDFNNGLVENNTASLEGGGLWNSATGTLRVSKTLIAGNTADGDKADDGGGGIFNNGGTVQVNDSSVDNNKATGTAGSGGGILSVAGNVAFSRANVRGNVANRAGGGIELIDGTLSYRFGQLNNNVAGPAGTASPGNGGGLHTTGNAQVSFFKSEAINNKAAKEGGGLWLAAGGNLDMQGSNLLGNTAAGALADDGGGGLFNNGGDVYVGYSNIDRNKATGAAGSGGGLFSVAGDVTLNQANFRTNSAVRAGGAVEVVAGDVDLIRAVLERNTTGPTPGNGGGLHVTGAANVDVTRTFVLANTASTEGGGLWNSATGKMTVTGSSVFDNVASGALANDGGGGIFNNGGTLAVNGTRIGGNVANGRLGAGGGVHLAPNSTATFSDTRISGNRAADNGGGVFNDGNATFDGPSSIFFNRARNGGGIFTDTGATTDLAPATFVQQNVPNNLAGGGSVV